MRGMVKGTDGESSLPRVWGLIWPDCVAGLFFVTITNEKVGRSFIRTQKLQCVKFDSTVAIQTESKFRKRN